MTTSRTDRVMVATSGSTASKAAITYGAREASARGLTLELVHVVTPAIAVGPYAASPDAALRHAGREVLVASEQVAHSVVPHLHTTTTLLTGSRPDAIVHHADGADLLVIGAMPRDLVERLWTGSTVMGIAARATCPVAIVPVGDAPPAKHQVLVGLKSTRHADHLLATAFAIARQTQSELRIVHAWHMMSPYDEAIAERLPIPDWAAEEARAIEGLLIDLRMAYPDVQVRVELVHGRPGFSLVEDSRDADIVAISRPAHGGFIHYLGATARTVIRDAECLVLVVPPLDEVGEREHGHAEAALTS